VGSEAHEIDGFKLWYSGGTRASNGAGILVDKELSDQMIEMRRKSDHIISIKLVVRAKVLNVICVYAPQVGLADDIKNVIWEDLDDVVQSVPLNEKLFIRGDFNGHIGDKTDGYDIMHGGFGFRERNSGGVTILDFAVAFDLMIVNSIFKKKEKHLVTFKSGSSKTHIDYLLIRANHRRMCIDCKVILSEFLGTQRRLLLMD